MRPAELKEEVEKAYAKLDDEVFQSQRARSATTGEELDVRKLCLDRLRAARRLHKTCLVLLQEAEGMAEAAEGFTNFLDTLVQTLYRLSARDLPPAPTAATLYQLAMLLEKHGYAEDDKGRWDPNDRQFTADFEERIQYG